MSANPTAELMSRQFTPEHCPVTRQVMPNFTRQFLGFYVSYARYLPEYGCHTTALVLAGRVFFILSGNHAIDMEQAAVAGGLDGGLDLYFSRIDQAHRISDHQAALGLAYDPFGLHETTLEALGQDRVDALVARLQRRVPAAMPLLR